jgi:hypothetical protein
MKLISAWSIRPGTRQEAVNRFLSGGGMPPSGVALLGRWHKADASGGFSLFETGDAAALYTHAAEWSQFLDIQVSIVLEDGEAAPILAKIFTE